MNGELQSTQIAHSVTNFLIIDSIIIFVVARGGIEPPTHGFSVRFKPLLLNYIG